MGNTTLRLQQVDEDTITYVETLLEGNDLPANDVESNPHWFYIGYDGDERVGIGGVEMYGAVGLLRSVVIQSVARGNGYGTGLCEALETKARGDGVARLYLLTTTAAEFFEHRGYVEVERSTVPDVIEQTTEFEELYPTTATCMKKSL